MFLQSLESRTLFAATAVLNSSSHELKITGTGSADTIEVTKSSSSLKVKLNGTTKTFTYSQVNTIYAKLGSGNDKFTMTDSVVKAAYINGESGNDTIVGGGQNDYLKGDSGDDKLDGGKGDDIMEGDSGTDTADYSNRTYDLKITLDGNADDGAKSGGHDNVWADIENVKCGSGNDVVVGSSKNNKIEGGDGNDDLSGQSGNDSLYGGNGKDSLRGNSGNDKCYGGNNNDWVDISDGSYGDYAQGDSGTDEIFFDKSGSSSDSQNGFEIKHS